jgi:hypothetical protein
MQEYFHPNSTYGDDFMDASKFHMEPSSPVLSSTGWQQDVFQRHLSPLAAESVDSIGMRTADSESGINHILKGEYSRFPTYLSRVTDTLMSIDREVEDAREIIQKHNTHNQDIEEMNGLLQEDNLILKVTTVHSS